MLLKFETVNNVLNKTIIKGFNNSTGWNRGKKTKSSHLFEPLTSTPKKGTNKRKINEMKKNIMQNLRTLFFSKYESEIKINTLKIINIKCFIKK